MWIDRVSAGAIAIHAHNIQVYRASFIFLAVVSTLVSRLAAIH